MEKFKFVAWLVFSLFTAYTVSEGLIFATLVFGWMTLYSFYLWMEEDKKAEFMRGLWKGFLDILFFKKSSKEVMDMYCWDDVCFESKESNNKNKEIFNNEFTDNEGTIIDENNVEDIDSNIDEEIKEIEEALDYINDNLDNEETPESSNISINEIEEPIEIKVLGFGSERKIIEEEENLNNLKKSKKRVVKKKSNTKEKIQLVTFGNSKTLHILKEEDILCGRHFKSEMKLFKKLTINGIKKEKNICKNCLKQLD